MWFNLLNVSKICLMIVAGIKKNMLIQNNTRLNKLIPGRSAQSGDVNNEIAILIKLLRMPNALRANEIIHRIALIINAPMIGTIIPNRTGRPMN